MNKEDQLAVDKVLMLYVLDNSNKPITNDVLYSIVSSASTVDYFYFQQFLLDLMQTKYVICEDDDSKKLYSLTAKGKEILDLTKDLMPGIIKLKADMVLKKNLDDFENEESIVAEYIPRSETEFEVICKIVEKGEAVFEVRTYAYSRAQAQNIVQNWKTNANKLYPEILDKLTNEKNNA